MTDDLSLRRLTPAGIDEWTAYLAAAKADPAVEAPTGLLDDPKLSEAVADVPVPARRFETRREAADFLTDLLSGLPESEAEKDVGLWDWLTLRYFDSVAPPEGGRKIGNAYRYHFQPENNRHWYRHLLYIGWHAKRTATPYERLFLESPVQQLDGYTESAFRSLAITRIGCIFEVLDRLYWDPEIGGQRIGYGKATKTAANIDTRFPRRLDQLELTYDLHSLSADRLIKLLGPEFQALDHGGAASAPAAKAKPAKRRRIPVTVG